jgi:hypothetical protein
MAAEQTILALARDVEPLVVGPCDNYFCQGYVGMLRPLLSDCDGNVCGRVCVGLCDEWEWDE